MSIKRKPAARRSLVVANKSLPVWERTPRSTTTDLSDRLGKQVAVATVTASRLLDIYQSQVLSFKKAGIVRDGRIISRPCEKTTYACVTESYWTRFYLEYGESLTELSFSTPEAWVFDTHERDYDGRICVRVRARQDGTADDLRIVTNRRIYSVRLVWNPAMVTLACSWTYPDPILMHAEGRRLLYPGDLRRDWRPPGMKVLTRFAVFRLGPDMRCQVLKWAAELRAVKASHLNLYKEMHRRATVPVHWKHPKTIINAVVSRALAVRSFSAPELRQWIPIPEDGQPMVLAIRAAADRILESRLALPSGLAPSVEDLAIAFPFLAGLPQTCLDDPDLYAAPPERARKIVWACHQVAAPAALFCVIAPLYVRRAKHIEAVLRQLKLLETMAERAGLSMNLRDSAAVSALIDHLLYGPDEERLGVNTRYSIARSLLLIIRLTRRYLRIHGRDITGGLEHFKPADPVQFPEALDNLSKRRTKLAARWRANRKERVFVHAGHVRRLEFAADLNLEQVVLTTRALKDAEADLGNAEWIDVPVPLTIVDSRGRLLPGKQHCVWRLWRPKAYVDKLLANPRNKGEKSRLDKLAAELSGGRAMAPICEYRRTEGVLGSTPIEPFFVRCWRFGLMMHPASLTPQIRRQRHAVLRELKLPGFERGESGLLFGNEEEMDLWRISLRQQRTIAFLQPFEHALRFAHLGLSSVLENLSRSTAWLQQTQDQSGWQIRRLNQQPVAGFLAHDKVSSQGEVPNQMSWFPVGPKHLAEAEELVAMTCERCGYADGLLPEIRHLDIVNWKRPESAAWTFSFMGKVLHPGAIGRFLRFLLPGHGLLTFHDFRHLLANAALAAGTPGWMIRLALNHASENLWLHYAQLSAAQLREIEDQAISSLVKRSADARATLAA